MLPDYSSKVTVDIQVSNITLISGNMERPLRICNFNKLKFDFGVSQLCRKKKISKKQIYLVTSLITSQFSY